MGCSSPNSDFGIQAVISCFKVIPSFCLKIGLIFFLCVLFFLLKKNDNLLNYFFRNSYVDWIHESTFSHLFLVHLEIIDLAADLMFCFFWLVDLFFLIQMFLEIRKTQHNIVGRGQKGS